MTEGLLSWGNYPHVPQRALPVRWRKDVAVRLAGLRARSETALGYGGGRSYGDSCLAASGTVLALRGLDRFLAADWVGGTITVEAGATLAELLAVAIPRGWFLPVTPGTQYATVGGAIANDVHGKNHHCRGTFGRHVLSFGLHRSDSGTHICSPERETALFAATIGGLGLTGVIEWAELRLMPIASSRIIGTTERFGSLAEFFALSDELDSRHEFAVAWVDCAARGKALGRGVYTVGDFAPSGEREVRRESRLDVPLTPPVSLVRPEPLRAFNTVYWRRAPRTRRPIDIGYNAFFYPLDGIGHWNRLYGRRGFQQYQAVVPTAAAEPGIRAMLAAIAAVGTGSFLAVLKRCGDLASPGLLSFPLAGTSLALDFPHSSDLVPLFGRLDAIVREAGGRLYPAKDAHMAGADFRHAYPAWKALEAQRDPVLKSRFWSRVTT